MAVSRLLCYLSIVEEKQCANAIRALDLGGAGGSGWALERGCRVPAVEEGGAGAVCARAPFLLRKRTGIMASGVVLV